jgi:ketosteroid isomerase-like protein
MSAANVSLAQSLYAAFGRGDIETIAAACAPNIRWQVKGRREDYPTLGVWHGPAGVRDFFKLVGETQSAVAFTQDEFHAAGDTVVVLGNYRWTVRKTGKPADADYVHVFTLKDGKVTAFREFTDTAQFAQAWRG